MIATITPGPSRLLDLARRMTGLASDAALARLCYIAPCVISNMRHGRLPITSSMLIRLHDETGISIVDLQHAGGIKPLTAAGRAKRGVTA